MKEADQSISEAICQKGSFGSSGHKAAKWKTSIGFQLQKIHAWFQVKMLERSLRKSKGFQKYCEQIGCPVLAEMEKAYQETLKRRIGRAAQYDVSIAHTAPVIASSHSLKRRISDMPAISNNKPK